MVSVHDSLCFSVALPLTDSGIRFVAACGVRGEGPRGGATQLDVVGCVGCLVDGRERALFGEGVEVVAEGKRGVCNGTDVFGCWGGREVNVTSEFCLPANDVLTVLFLLSNQLWHTLWRGRERGGERQVDR